MRTIRITRNDQDPRHMCYADYDSVRKYLKAGWTTKPYMAKRAIKAIEPPHCEDAYADLCESVDVTSNGQNHEFTMIRKPDLGNGIWLILPTPRNPNYGCECRYWW